MLSIPDILSDADDEKALLVNAIKIRAEVNAELARLRSQGETSEHDSKLLRIPSNASHATSITGSTSPVSVSALNSTTSLSHVTSTPLQSPVASVLVTPSSLVPASIPTLVAGVKSTYNSKSMKTTHALVSSNKKKDHGQGRGSLRRKRPVADPNAPKKPSNAFFWFCQEKRAPLQEQFRGEGMSGQHDLTKALAKLWGETAAENKKVHSYINRVA